MKNAQTFIRLVMIRSDDTSEAEPSQQRLRPVVFRSTTLLNGISESNSEDFAFPGIREFRARNAEKFFSPSNTYLRSTYQSKE